MQYGLPATRQRQHLPLLPVSVHNSICERSRCFPVNIAVESLLVLAIVINVVMITAMCKL